MPGRVPARRAVRRSLLAFLLAPTLALAGGVPAFTSGFDPARHGLNFVNYGDFGNPGGNCWGMSVLAIHDFQTSRGQAIAPQLVQPPQSADVQKQIVASLVQAELSLTNERGRSGENPRQSATTTAPIQAALERVRSGGVPEVLIYTNSTSGHANVLYGYDGQNLLLYDPNDPGQTMRWPWDPQKGFGDHPKKTSQGGLFADAKWFSSTPFSQFQVSARLTALRQACLSRDQSCVGRFPDLQARLERESRGDLVVVGRIGTPQLPRPSGSGTPPSLLDGSVWVSSNGRYLIDGKIRKPRANNGVLGVFVLKLPKGLSLPGGSLRVVILSKDGTFAGYVDVPVKPEHQTGGKTPGRRPSQSAPTRASQSR